MVSYFEFFDLPIAFAIDLSALKQQYFKNSKLYHPDLHAQSAYSDQEEMLKKSTVNNLAYKTLSKQDKRIAHVLELSGKIGGDVKPAMPQSFLMEMMDVNEQVMELQMDFDKAAHSTLLKDIDTIVQSLEADVAEILIDPAPITQDDPRLAPITDYYLKKKYILRLQDNINGITPEM